MTVADGVEKIEKRLKRGEGHGGGKMREGCGRGEGALNPLRFDIESFLSDGLNGELDERTEKKNDICVNFEGAIETTTGRGGGGKVNPM